MTLTIRDTIQSNIPVSLRRSRVGKFVPIAFRSRVSFECWLAFVSGIRELKLDARCPRRPAVEITRYVTIDGKTGEIEIPEGPRFVRPFPNDWSQGYYPWNSSHPRGKPWRDVDLYSKSER